MKGEGSLSQPIEKKQQYKVPKESELRVEVSWEGSAGLRLLSGSAEIFGTELPPHSWMSFPPGHKIAAFTWDGAVIEINGSVDSAYISDETPMASYANVHAVLECRRTEARDSMMSSSLTSPASPMPVQGPRVMVVGPTDSGKSSLTRMLLSWAARKGWKPTFVDLDIGQGSITIPGTIAATTIERPIHPTEGVSLEVPLVYYYGHTTPSVNAELYGVLVNELSHTLEVQLAGNIEACTAGMVINTMGWVDGLGYELLFRTIEAFNPNMVLVLGQEKLYFRLLEDLKFRPRIVVVMLQKSAGVVARNQKCRQQMRNVRIKEYFYGPSGELTPHRASASCTDLQIFRIIGPKSSSQIATESAPVTITPDLVHSVLAVSYAKDPEHLLSSNIAGFIYITDVETESERVSYVAPCPGPLPSKLLILGTLQWAE